VPLARVIYRFLRGVLLVVRFRDPFGRPLFLGDGGTGTDTLGVLTLLSYSTGGSGLLAYSYTDPASLPKS
jgi:hypothetical protein